MKNDLFVPKIFLSYSRSDKEKVDALYQELTRVGLQPWMDIHDIEPGTDWKREILKHIRESAFFLACISDSSVQKRGIIQVELKEALDVWREKLDDDIFLIPVRLEECSVPESLSRFQWVDLFTEKGKELLIKTLISRSEQMGLFINKSITDAVLPIKTPIDVLREYLDKINGYKRPRLIVEGINTDDIKPHIQHAYGKNYSKDILVPDGSRCIYFLEYKSWQGTNGSEDISDLVIDFLVFDKSHIIKAAEHYKDHRGFYYSLRGERLRDDGFWEDGSHDFKFTHLQDIPIEILVDLNDSQFDITHYSNIELHLHPNQYSVTSDENYF